MMFSSVGPGWVVGPGGGRVSRARSRRRAEGPAVEVPRPDSGSSGGKVSRDHSRRQDATRPASFGVNDASMRGGQSRMRIMTNISYHYDRLSVNSFVYRWNKCRAANL